MTTDTERKDSSTTTNVDDDIIELNNNNNNSAAQQQQQTTTVVVDENSSLLLVDQVPQQDHQQQQQPDTPTVANTVKAISVSDRLTLGEDTILLLDEQPEHFGPLVDHLPPNTINTNDDDDIQPSVVVQYDEEENLDEEDDEEDNKTLEEDDEEVLATNTNNLKTSFLVDHVPTSVVTDDNDDALLRGSIYAVASQASNNPDTWREDFDPNEDDYGPVVDHLPSQTNTSRFVKTSSILNTPSNRTSRSATSIFASGGRIIEEEYEKDNNSEKDSTKAKFGIFSSASVADDSIAAVAPIIAEDDDDDDDEENYTAEQVTIDDDDGNNTADGVVAGDEGIVSNNNNNNNNNNVPPSTLYEPLVDYVPLRPGGGGGRPAVVMDNQSEFSITVGDMTYDDVQFGPVVDHTPNPHTTFMSPQAEASIMAAATKSECSDDLDDDDDTLNAKVGGEEDEAYAMGTTGDYDGVTLETSIGSAAAAATATANNDKNKLLVDHIPSSDNDNNIDDLRRSNCSSANAIEGSTIISNTNAIDTKC